jgi:hypothetical protein
MQVGDNSAIAGEGLYLLMPVTKGAQVFRTDTGGAVNDVQFRFYYANGEVPTP